MSTVLVVDDEPLIRWAVRQILEDAGYAVVEAGSAAEALTCIGEADGRPVSVALLDLRLPDSDDLTLLRLVRGQAPACRIILMTAHGSPEILADAIEQGAFATVSKPFDLSNVLHVVRAAEKAA
jgi:DNA-binding NtrC family response regulator